MELNIVFRECFISFQIERTVLVLQLFSILEEFGPLQNHGKSSGFFVWIFKINLLALLNGWNTR